MLTKRTEGNLDLAAGKGAPHPSRGCEGGASRYEAGIPVRLGFPLRFRRRSASGKGRAIPCIKFPILVSYRDSVAGRENVSGNVKATLAAFFAGFKGSEIYSRNRSCGTEPRSPARGVAVRLPNRSAKRFPVDSHHQLTVRSRS